MLINWCTYIYNKYWLAVKMWKDLPKHFLFNVRWLSRWVEWRSCSRMRRTWRIWTRPRWARCTRAWQRQWTRRCWEPSAACPVLRLWWNRCSRNGYFITLYSFTVWRVGIAQYSTEKVTGIICHTKCIKFIRKVENDNFRILAMLKTLF